MNKPRGWRFIKPKCLTIIRNTMDSGGDWNEAMKKVESILGPQFPELPNEGLIKSWWEESEVKRSTQQLGRSGSGKKDEELRNRVETLERTVEELAQRVAELEG